MIDGARSKWCHLLLLNAIVGILDFESFNLAARRKFNQQQVLYECLKAELEEKGIEESKEDGSAATITATLDACWHDMKAVRNFLEKSAPYKSKDKYWGIMDHLLGHKAIQTRGGDIAKCINAAIAKILAPTNRKSKRREAHTAPVVIRSKRVLAALAETATKPPAAAEDDEPDHQVTKRPRRSPAKKASVPVEPEGAPMAQSPPRPSRKKTPSAKPKLQTPAVVATSEAVRPPPLASRRASRIYPARRAAAPSTAAAAAGVSTKATDSVTGDEDWDSSDDGGHNYQGGFPDSHEIDTNAQEWELLESSGERQTSPKHYLHGGVVHRLDPRSPVLDKRVSPFAAFVGTEVHTGTGTGTDTADGNGTVATAPSGLHLIQPALCPFPSAEDLRAVTAARMGPFPLLGARRSGRGGDVMATLEGDGRARAGLPMAF